MDNQQERIKADLNWLAGIWEGEGWFSMQRNTKKSSNGIYLDCGVANTDISLMDSVMTILSEHFIPFQAGLRNMTGRFGKKPQHHIRIRGFLRVKRFLTLILPFLRGEKKERAVLISKYIKYRELLPSHNVKTGDYEWSLYDQLRALNGTRPLLSSETNTLNTVRTVKIESELQRELQRLVECQPALA